MQHSTFNYRIVKKKEHGTTFYTICSVYYDSKDKIDGIGDDNIVVGNSVDDLRYELKLLKQAFDDEVVDAEKVLSKN